ncbi:MAG: endonuclease/exonuclease/phosphatase family protein [Promethearchaeota archaeon]
MSNRLKLIFFIVLIFITISATVSIIVILPTTFSNSNKRIKVMTWNISGAVGIDDKFNINRIIDEIDEQDPDIIGLQEVDSKVQISNVAERLDMNYYYAKAGNTDEGNAILSKYKIKDVEVIDLPLIDGTRPRILLKVKLLIEHKNFYIYITHFSRYDKPKDHKNQANFVGNYISKHTQSRFILMGDLNFSPESEAYSELMNNNKVTKIDTYRYVNQDSGNTFRSGNLFKRIDYIICSYDLNPTQSEVICTQASDHCAVLTKFQI